MAATSSNVGRLNAKVNSLKQEARDTPMVRAAKFDPPPASVAKSLWISRKVRVSKQFDTSPPTKITVDDVKAQSSTGAFKVSKICAWAPGQIGATFVLSEKTWAQDTTNEIAYTDISPPGRMPGVSFNIPDQLSTVLNTGTDVLLSVTALAGQVTTGLVVVDFTIRYQI